MAWHEGHLVEVGHVPGADDDAPAVGVALECVHDLCDLIDMAATRFGPAAPLHAIDRAEVTILARPFVPDRAAALLQPFDVAPALQKPQQLDDDGLEKDLFGGDERKALAQVKSHLVAEDAAGAGAGAVVFFDAMRVDMAHEVFVLAANGAGAGKRHGRQVYGKPGQARSCAWTGLAGPGLSVCNRWRVGRITGLWTVPPPAQASTLRGLRMLRGSSACLMARIMARAVASL